MSWITSKNLWVCHRCEMLGNAVEARAHFIAAGHDVEELTAEVSTVIRKEQADAATERAGRLVAARRSGYLPLTTSASTATQPLQED